MTRSTYRARILALLDREGPMAIREIARRVGCSYATAKDCRREWLRGDESRRTREGVPICRRCEIADDAKNPVKDGLCLWCRLEQVGVDLRHFYESGEAAACGLASLEGPQ